MPKYTQAVTNIFDLKKDDDGVLRMPFNPADYGEDNGILRECFGCGKEFAQGKMQELYSLHEKAQKGGDKLYASSIFFCEDCWFSGNISNAAYWNA